MALTGGLMQSSSMHEPARITKCCHVKMIKWPNRRAFWGLLWSSVWNTRAVSSIYRNNCYKAVTYVTLHLGGCQTPPKRLKFGLIQTNDTGWWCFLIWFIAKVWSWRWQGCYCHWFNICTLITQCAVCAASPCPRVQPDSTRWGCLNQPSSTNIPTIAFIA